MDFFAFKFDQKFGNSMSLPLVHVTSVEHFQRAQQAGASLVLKG